MVILRAMVEAEAFDYHGALVVVETSAHEIVFTHPPGHPPMLLARSRATRVLPVKSRRRER